MQVMPDRLSVRSETATAVPRLRLAGLILAAAAALTGCGNASGLDSSTGLVSGLPKCDPSLLHPRITVAAAAGLPGKLIVYVDGVMACMDDASRVDQIVPQVEGHIARPTELPPLSAQ